VDLSALSARAEAAEAIRMERSLYMRGVGYSYDAVKIFMPAGAKKPVYAPYIEHIPPDTTAAIFWLKNRDPAHWREAARACHRQVCDQRQADERGGVDQTKSCRGRWR
jgi:hypothetical protein